MMLKGVATEDPKPLEQLTKELVAEGVYRVEPKTQAANTLTNERRTFPLQFTIRYDVERRPPATFSRTLTAEPPGRKSRSRGGEGGGGINIFDLIGGGAPQ